MKPRGFQISGKIAGTFLLGYLAFFVVYEFIPEHRSLPGQSGRTVVEHFRYGPIFGYTIIALCLAGLIVGFARNLKWTFLRWALWLTPLLLVLLVAARAITIDFWNPDYWILLSQASDPDGGSFAELECDILQGQSSLLTKVLPSSFWFDRYEVLVEGSGYSDGVYLPLVRPTSPKFDEGGLYCVGNWVVFMWGTNQLELVYNTQTHRGYSSYGSSLDEGRRDTVFELSPFIFVKPGDLLNPDDKKALLAAGVGDGQTQPRPSVIKIELQNKNPEVRALAKQLLSNLAAKGPDSP